MNTRVFYIEDWSYNHHNITIKSLMSCNAMKANKEYGQACGLMYVGVSVDVGVDVSVDVGWGL